MDERIALTATDMDLDIVERAPANVVTSGATNRGPLTRSTTSSASCPRAPTSSSTAAATRSG